MIGLADVTFAYEGNPEPSLRGVTCDIGPGQLVALAGPSGCGKTTITRLVGGLIPEFFAGELTGTVTVGGIDPTVAPTWRTSALVGSVFQNPRTQFFTTDAESELAFGCENLGRPVDETRARVSAALDAYQLTPLVGRSVFSMSGGEKQRLACAAVATAGPPVIVLDEPSANLDAVATADLRQAIRGWVTAGVTVLIAEHRLSYIQDLIDQVVVLASGRVVRRLTGDELRRLDAPALAQLGLRALTPPSPVAASGEALAQAGVGLRGVRYSRRARTVPGALPGPKRQILDIDELEFPAGAVTAILGPNGAGKSSLLECLAGLHDADGEITVDGRALSARQRRAMVYLVMQDVSHQLFTDSVAEEVRLALPRTDEGAGVAAVLDRFDLRDVADRHPLALSGGQQQRVAIACALASGRPVIALDEPTSGLDVIHMRQVAAALAEVAAAGRTVLVATHDAEFTAAVAAAAVHLDAGRVVR